MTALSQPPNSSRPKQKPPDWRRPRGVAPGTWAYTNERSIADHYDAFVADTPLCRTDQSVLSDLFPQLTKPQSVKIVDLGCGSGRSALELAARGYVVVGVDLSQSMLEVARKKSAQENALPSGGNLSLVRANLVELDCFAPDTFDHAVCMFSTLGMIQGREHRHRLLHHVAQVVLPGGRFVFHVHHRWAALAEPSGFKRLATSWWKSKRSVQAEFGDATYSYRGIDDMFMHRFSRHELEADLTATGWLIEKIDCLSADGAKVIPSPRVMRQRVGGFIVTARNEGSSKPGASKARTAAKSNLKDADW